MTQPHPTPDAQAQAPGPQAPGPRRLTCTLAQAPQILAVILAAQMRPADGTPRPTVDDFDTAALEYLDYTAQSIVIAPGISPKAAQTLSNVRHAIAQIIRIRQEHTARYAAQDAAQATAPPPSSDGGRPVLAPRTPPPSFPRPGGLAQAPPPPQAPQTLQTPPTPPRMPQTAPPAPAWTF